MKRALRIALLLLAVGLIARGWIASRVDSAFDVEGFAELPVQLGGRIKPLDSVARNTVLILSNRQTVITPKGEELSPAEWLMDLTMRPAKADTYRVFKIEFPDDLGIPGLGENGRKYYSFNDIRPHFETIDQRRSKVPEQAEKRSAVDEQIVELHSALTRYHRVMHSFHPIGPPERLDALVDEYASYRKLIGPGMKALREQRAGKDVDSETLDRFLRYGDDYLQLSKTAKLRIIPPKPPAEPLATWENIGEELLGIMRGDSLSPFAQGYAAMTMAYRAGDAETFNREVQKLQRRFASNYPDTAERVSFERSFNAFQPFYQAMTLYVLAFLLIGAGWLAWPGVFHRSAFWTILVAFAVHTAGLIARMYLQGRPPVTNLYSSAVFVGWGSVLLGILIERFYRNGVGGAMASLVGFCTLIIAHHLSMSGDTLEMMQAVLDSNFWLATHVVVITIGYSAMFLAGALAIGFTLAGVFARGFHRQAARDLSGMVYGVTCFAVLFSLVGTILGGIWADQSWGRFWGWDPKENGALMIVIMGAIVLHARWGGLVRERGIMALAICGNIITAWSWFGTNLLGVGFHSYGFTESGFFWLAGFVLSQLALIATALLPWRYWRSAFGRERHLKERRRNLIAGDAAADASETG